MKKYIIKRLLQLIPILLGITFLSFAMMRMAGSDAVTEIYSNQSGAVSAEVIEQAREKLISANQRFVYAIAKRYGNDDNVLDLVNEGNKGLMTALDSYDPEKKNRLLSYAVWYITRDILAYLNGENVLIRKTNNTKTKSC